MILSFTNYIGFYCTLLSDKIKLIIKHSFTDGTKLHLVLKRCIRNNIERNLLMTNYNSVTDIDNMIDKITNASKNLNLVVFIGAGVSLSQGYPNWDGYVEKLIHFWEFNFQNYLEEKDRISSQEFLQFDQILKMKVSNKRKIDLLNTLLESIFADKYQEISLDFEKYFFEKVVPIKPENEILAEVAKLDPIFMTSNYDFEIEKQVRRTKQKMNFHSISNINDFTSSESMLRPNDILHLHGSTNGSPEFFINSSLDYSKQYLQNSTDLANLKSWLKRTKPVILFVGSSMEEDEILSILPEASESFALMKANSKETSEFRALFNQTFVKNYSTNIIWYGDKYSDLPKMLHKIITTVLQKREISSNQTDWYKLTSLSLPLDAFQEILQKHSEDPSFLYDIFNTEELEIQKKLAFSCLQTQKAIDPYLNIPHFWTFILNFFDDLKSDMMLRLITMFQTKKINLTISQTYDVYKCLKNSSKLNPDILDKINKSISSNNYVFNSAFNQDPLIMAEALIQRLNADHNIGKNIFISEDVVSFNLDDDLSNQMAVATKDNMQYRFYSFSDLVETNETIRLIYHSLKEKKVLYKMRPILDNFPDILLSVRLFQRILVNIDNENSLPDKTLTSLIGAIDFQDHEFGTELNKFLSSHHDLISEKHGDITTNYENGMGTIEGGSVRESSLIDMNELLTFEDADLIEALLGSESNHSDQNFLIERTPVATSKFLLENIKNNNLVEQKLINLFQKYGNNLYPKYEYLFVELILNKNGFFPRKLIELSVNIVVEGMSTVSFGYETNRLFETLIKQERIISKLFNKIFDFDVRQLDSTYVISNETRPRLLEIIDFINTELGSYLDTLISWYKIDKSKHNEIKQVVEKIPDNQFKEFTQGAFLGLRLFNLTQISINQFQGYSFVVRGFQEDQLKKFIPASLEILQSGLVNEFNQYNVFIICLKSIDPSTQSNAVDFNSINFSILFDLILNIPSTFPHEVSWVTEIIKNDTTGENTSSLIHSLSNRSNILPKTKKLFNILEDSLLTYPAKIDLTLFPSYINKQSQVEIKDLFINLIFASLDNSKIEKNFINRSSIFEIMNLLPNFYLRNKLAQHKELAELLSPLEVEQLKRKINP